MAWLSRNFSKTEREAKILVKLLTGFSEEDINFKLCMNFVTSNFKYHHYTDVDSHKVKRNIEGICQKFDVHCEYEKRDSLARLSQEFLYQGISEEYFYPESDIHYAMLLILLETSVSPVKAEYLPAQKSKSAPEVEDDFDWGAYLLEGEEDYCYRGPFPDTPDVTDDEDDISLDEDTVAEADNSDKRIRSAADFPERGCGDTTDPSLATVAESVVVPYWKNETDAILFDDHFASSRLNHDWQEQRSNGDILKPTTNHNTAVLTENQLIRETIWMLNGVTVLFAFRLDGGHFELNPCVRLSHVVSDTLRRYLTKAAETAPSLHELLNFVRAKPDRGECRTYEAFRNAVSDEFLAGFFARLNDLETVLILQEEAMTLLKFFESIRAEFRLIDLLHRAYVVGVKTVDPNGPCPNVTRSSTLLTTLYDTAFELDQSENGSHDDFRLILNVFVRTCEPYLNTVDLWLRQGVLLDPAREFPVQKNTELTSLDVGFWDKAYTVYCKQKNVNSSLNSQPPDGNLTAQDLIMPQFLEPVLNSVILAGKSAEMLHVMWRRVSGLPVERALFDDFLQNMKAYFSSSNEKNEFNPGQIRRKKDDDVLVCLKSDEQLDPCSVVESLFKLNLKHQMKTVYKTDLHHDKTGANKYHIDVTLHPKTFVRSLEKCLNPLVDRLYTFICGKLIEVLKKEYHLLDTFRILRQFYLLEAGDVMFEFYSEIFDKIRKKEPWRDVSFLNIQLQECCSRNRWPGGIGGFTVTLGSQNKVEGSRSRNKTPVNILKDLELHFEATWPVDIIISTNALNIYKQIFTLLLQVKYSKYSLDNLIYQHLMEPESGTTSDLQITEASKVALSKKALLLRMRLMHFVNGVHTYILTRILHSTGLEFESDMSEALDLDNIVTAHNNYLGKLYERCLLHSRVSMIREAIMKVLNLAIHFQIAWDEGVLCLKEKTLDKMDREFQICNRFILSSLKVAVRRASLPHLDSLLMSLAPYDNS